MSPSVLAVPLRVLYVEDNALVREMTYELLADDGRQVRAYATAEAALKEFDPHTVDVVITDVSLPDMSGLELARNILSKVPDVPIIIASGYALDVGLEKLGPNVRSIVKPFDAEQIGVLLRDLCEPPNVARASRCDMQKRR
jgi:two-component system, cell cycle response regulator CpdR